MKKSLLDLIPANKGLHSAIFTTFSLDGYFLENLVGKWRSKGIVNILGLADGIMFDESFGQVYAQKNLGKSYMVMGYPPDRLLHSKINLFIGKENALLIIGSGNVSMHGFGKNLETFNYFFFEGPADPKVQLLYECWSYLKSRFVHFDAEALIQIKWIKEDAVWIENLTSFESDPWVTLETGNAVSFIANNKSTGSLRQFVDRIPINEIYRVTILSPFHDVSGTSITNLKNAFEQAKIRIVLQKDYGEVPQKLDLTDTLLYNYTDVIGGDWGKNPPPNHFHSKLYIFEGTKSFYIYSGSANATLAGLGTIVKTANNEEAGILWRTAPFNIEEYFGFNFDQEQNSLSYFQKENKSKDPYSHRHVSQYFIKAAILDNFSLKIKLNKQLLENNCTLKVYDQECNEILSLSLSRNSDVFSWQMDKLPGKDFCSVMIENEQGEPLTRKQILLNKDYLRKTNPSEKNRFIGKAEEALSSGLLNDPAVLEAIIALFSFNEETKKKKIDLSKRKVIAEKEEKAEFIEYTREEVELAIRELLENEKNNNQSERDFLESIDAATRRVLEGREDDEQEDEAEAMENPNPTPPKAKDTPKKDANEKEIIKIKNRLNRIWHTAFLIGKSILDSVISSEDEFSQRLISLNLSFFAFFAYGYNSYNIKKEAKNKTVSLYPDYGHFTEHESRYSIFLTLCGTFLNILPFLNTFGSDPGLKKYLNSMVAQVLIGINVFHETDESKQSEKERILSEVIMNLKYFIPEENWNEIDLTSMANRIMIQNNKALEISLDHLNSATKTLLEKNKSLTEPEYLYLDNLGCYRVENYLPDGEFTEAKSFLLRRLGFPYLIETSENTSYKRLYNKNKAKFFEGTTKTMSGYNKRVKK